MAVTIQQAAAKALAAFLDANLDVDEVTDRWPEPDQELPGRVVTVLLAGARQDEHWDAEVVKVEPDPEGGNPTYHHKVRTIEQPIHLDVWAPYEAQRDDLLAQLDNVLHLGTRYTLNDHNGDPTRDGPLLALASADGHEGFVDFTFDGPAPNDTPGRHIRSEYRGTVNGTAATVLVVKSQLPALKVAGIRLRFGEIPGLHEVVPIEVSLP